MQRMRFLMLLPFILLVACQSSTPQRTVGQCNPRQADAGQCNLSSSISEFPELSNVH